MNIGTNVLRRLKIIKARALLYAVIVLSCFYFLRHVVTLFSTQLRLAMQQEQSVEAYYLSYSAWKWRLRR
jgi:hypothetical protein